MVKLTLAPRMITLLLSGAVFCFTLSHLAVNYSTFFLGHDRLLGFAYRLNVDMEVSIPTWYASSTLLLCSILLAVIWRAKKQNRDAYSPHWMGLAVIFLYLSLDEAASLHEMTIEPIRSAFDLTGVLYYAWVIPGAIFVSIVGLAYTRFLVALPTLTRGLFLLAGIVYVGGAIGMELVGANYRYLYGRHNWTYAVIVGIEECLEMIGVVIFIHALTSYISSHVGRILVVIGDKVTTDLNQHQRTRHRDYAKVS